MALPNEAAQVVEVVVAEAVDVVLQVVVEDSEVDVVHQEVAVLVVAVVDHSVVVEDVEGKY